MNLLSIDASGKTASVCILQGGHLLQEEFLDEGLTHSETLLALVQKALGLAGLEAADIGAYAVTAGPGSFTGLRIGLSLVKGLALPHSTPVVPVSTLHAHALASGCRGVVVAALDARRSEVYWAAFQCGDTCLRLTNDAAGPAAGIPVALGDIAVPQFFVGDGADLCYNVYGSGQVVSLAHTVARGAALYTLQHIPDALPAEDVYPIYLRLSQAQRERAARQAQNSTSQGDHHYG